MNDSLEKKLQALRPKGPRPDLRSVVLKQAKSEWDSVVAEEQADRRLFCRVILPLAASIVLVFITLFCVNLVENSRTVAACGVTKTTPPDDEKQVQQLVALGYSEEMARILVVLDAQQRRQAKEQLAMNKFKVMTEE